jgi:hypothetical protein
MLAFGWRDIDKPSAGPYQPGVELARRQAEMTMGAGVPRSAPMAARIRLT